MKPKSVLPIPTSQMTWDELAAELGTTRRTLQTWRREFPDAPKDRSRVPWEDFMRDRRLGHFSMRRNAPLPPARPNGRNDEHRSMPWMNRSDVIAAPLFQIEEAYLAGEISFRELSEMYEPTFEAVCAIGRAFGAFGDGMAEEKAFRKAWLSNLCRCALVENEKSKAAKKTPAS